MNRLMKHFFALLLGLTLVAPLAMAEKKSEEQVLAEVGGQKITRAELESTLNDALGGQINQLSPKQRGALEYQILEGMVRVNMLRAAAEKAGVSVTPEEVEKEVARRKAIYASRGRPLPQEKNLEEFVEKDLMVAKYLDKTIFKNVTVDEAKLREAFKSYPKDAPAQVRARHILFKADEKAKDEEVAAAKAKAEAVMKEAKAKPDTFPELAKKHSEGPSASSGGDLGFFAKERMVPPFSEAAFAMKPGEISDPVRTRFGFHVIKVEERKEAKEVKYEEVREQLRSQVQRKEREQLLVAHLDKLRKEMNVKVYLEQQQP